MGKTVLIIGAGCSVGVDGSLPLDKEFMERNYTRITKKKEYSLLRDALDRLYTYYPHKYHDEGWKKARLEIAWSEIRGNSYNPRIILHPREIEEIYTEIKRLSKEERDNSSEYCYYSYFDLVDKSNKTPYQYLFMFAEWQLRNIVQQTYSKTIDDNGKIIYNKLLKLCKNNSDTIEIISFNYDTLIEQALNNYCYPGIDTHSRGIRVIKPHGSVNWLERKKRNIVSCKNPVSTKEIGYDKRNIFHQPSIVGLIDIKNEYTIKASSIHNMYYRDHIRSKFINSLYSADKIVIVGYSFPSGDRHIRGMLLDLKENIKNKNKICKNVIMINLFKDKNEIDKMHDNLFYLFHVDKNKIKIYNNKWEEWIKRNERL